MQKYNVVESVWYNKIGIVTVVDDFGNQKMYIGLGDGFNQEDDEQQIAAYGTSFYPEIFQKNY